MGEARKDALRVEFDRSIKIEFHGSTVSSDGIGSGAVCSWNNGSTTRLAAPQPSDAPARKIVGCP